MKLENGILTVDNFQCEAKSNISEGVYPVDFISSSVFPQGEGYIVSGEWYITPGKTQKDCQGVLIAEAFKEGRAINSYKVYERLMEVLDGYTALNLEVY